MVQRLGELYGVPVYETQVGFKFLGPKMMETDALIGGEESGGYGFRGHVPERDGILAGLYMLDFMARTRQAAERAAGGAVREGRAALLRPPRRDAEARGPRQRSGSARSRRGRTRSPGIKVTSRDTTDGFRFMLGDKGWLLLRFSGTEPLLRIYTEVVGDESLVPRCWPRGARSSGLRTTLRQRARPTFAGRGLPWPAADPGASPVPSTRHHRPLGAARAQGRGRAQTH